MKNKLALLCSAIIAQIEADAANANATPRFSMVGYTGAAIRQWWSKNPMVIDLAGMSYDQQLPIRMGHDPANGVGHTDSVAIQSGQLVASGVISRDTEAAREVASSARKGFPWQASIGASIDQLEFIQENQSVLVNGKEFKGPISVVRKSTLGEISFVDRGADSRTSASVAANAQEETEVKKTLEQIEAGLRAAAKSHRDSARLVLANIIALAQGIFAAATEEWTEASYETEINRVVEAEAARVTATATNTQPDAVVVMRERMAAETERISAINTLCGTKHGKIAAQAIREGWTRDKVELEVMRADRPTAPAVHIVNAQASEEVVQAAVCSALRLADHEKKFSAPTLEAAHKIYRGRIGLQQMIMQAAHANGYSEGYFATDPRAALRAAFSTFSLPGILSNVANKFLLEAFMAVEQAWRELAAIRNVQDFKQTSSYRLTGDQKYEEVAADGKLKSGKVGELAYFNQVKTYGKLFSLTRQDIINDDLGALAGMPRLIGRGAGLKLNDVFWTAFMNNASFFTTGNKNYATGTGTALSINSLQQASQMFLDQTDADGNPMAITPVILLVTTALQVLAQTLMHSLEVRDTTANTKYGVYNPFAGKYKPVTSTYLSNAKFTGYSSAAWYLLASPADMPVVEVAFLNGQELPTVESTEADFDELGIKFRGYHDFGVALQEQRGGVKMKGEA